MPTGKKVKGQLPYQAYLTLKKAAENERTRVSAILLRLVEQAVKGPVIYGWRHVEHAAERRTDSPNAVHFMADERLLWRFEYFKRINKIASDSVAIRAIVLRYCEDERNRKLEIAESHQPRLFI